MACSTCNSTTICNCEDSVLTLPSGPQGIPGEKGKQGVQGLQGIQGPSGTNGTVGPTTCKKMVFTFPLTANVSYTVTTGVFFTAAGMLFNIGEVNGTVNPPVFTASKIAEVSDFVWQLWRAEAGGTWIDSEVENTLTGFTILSGGDISLVSNITGNFRLIIIG